ncbi:UDP-N-acetyl-D-mannosamine dehydrogenase [Desulfonema limicola]|uniref:UDP-N-acetyl-D-mannosamine dehydrogenase n=1 Tax=Desulfonema limicola TaxID=45656 RepID=A0A975GJ84_9BACT|nr:nucleotide sugar dehydrogenase [Desulfonema limicola]QTA83279.1 UDP-N-acetyl-D-mannosamine dehydrogenase [Desulfonema limicola]
MVTIESLDLHEDTIAIVGLGYVGLPLAVHLSKHFKVTGYDLKSQRIKELESGIDKTLEVNEQELQDTDIFFTDNPEHLSKCRFIIVAVPTPIDEYRIPDLGPLESSSSIVGKHLVSGSCIVFESTVYPGATQEVCLPIIEQESGLKLGADFTLGYSPERINPGDKVHTIESIIKIVSGSDQAALDLLTHVYGKVVKAGLHKASSIKVAEAAKVIENTQRDLNIALMNELSMIFDKIGIDTAEVLEAAGSKWNFLPFKPGLVGGHCIGVDPYYLTFKAESIGYHPDMILAGRRINDGMAKFIAEKTVKMLIKLGKQVRGARIGVLGLTFKEDVPDLRNTKVIDIISELEDYGINVLVHDPLADPEEARKYYNIELQPMENMLDLDAVILAVIHKKYKDMGLLNISRLCPAGSSLVVDIKSAFSPEDAEKLNIKYWRL